MHVAHYRQVQAPVGASECLRRSTGGYVATMSEEEIRNLERRGPELVYMAVADDIARRISSGELGPGDRLPGELDMVARYGIARMTASRAVRELRERGLVQTVRGKGTFVI
ncbi:GntR family transcriptional regulator [Streptomyces parvus]|uniref:GntR family transcriptional regulator n=1 Tax=Streptomyces parvus TaxID=66428 RepID=UPI0033C74164